MTSTLAPTPTAAGARCQPRMGSCSSLLRESEGRIPTSCAKAGPYSLAIPSPLLLPTPFPSGPSPPRLSRRDAKHDRHGLGRGLSLTAQPKQSYPSRCSPDALVKTNDRLPVASVACEQPMAPGEKHVSFGEVTITEHPRWIDQDEHVHFPAPCEPVPRGPMPPSLPAHYASEWPSWALRTSPQLDIHLARPCDDPHCAWNSVAKFRLHFPAELFRSLSSIAKLGLR